MKKKNHDWILLGGAVLGLLGIGYALKKGMISPLTSLSGAAPSFSFDQEAAAASFKYDSSRTLSEGGQLHNYLSALRGETASKNRSLLRIIDYGSSEYGRTHLIDRYERGYSYGDDFTNREFGEILSSLGFMEFAG